MNYKLIISILGGVAYLILFASFFVRRKYVTLNAGKLLLKLPGNVSAKDIVIFIFAAAMIAAILLRNFALYLDVMFVAIALLAEEIAIRDLMVSNNAGVYEKKILFGTYSFFYDEIEMFPTLAYEDDPETTNVDKRFLKVILKNGKQVDFGFNDENLRNQVVQTVLSVEPRLKPEN